MVDAQTSAALFDGLRQAMLRSFAELLVTKTLTPQEIDDEIEATRSALASLAALGVER